MTETTDPAPAPLAALLDQLDELRAKATPGPWSNPKPFDKLIDAPGSTDNLAIVQADYATDAALIVAAVNALPELIAELRKHHAAVRAVLELADKWEKGATRWEHPLPVPTEVDAIRAAVTAALSVTP